MSGLFSIVTYFFNFIDLNISIVNVRQKCSYRKEKDSETRKKLKNKEKLELKFVI